MENEVIMNEVIRIVGNISADVQNYVRFVQGLPAPGAAAEADKLRGRVLAAVEEIIKIAK